MQKLPQCAAGCWLCSGTAGLCCSIQHPPCIHVATKAHVKMPHFHQLQGSLQRWDEGSWLSAEAAVRLVLCMMRGLLSVLVEAVFKAPVVVATCCCWPPVSLCTGVQQHHMRGNCFHADLWAHCSGYRGFFFFSFTFGGSGSPRWSLLALFAVIP